MYAWFAKWFLGAENVSAFKEIPFQVEPDNALLTFSGREMPSHALKQEAFLPTWANRTLQAIEKRETDE